MLCTACVQHVWLMRKIKLHLYCIWGCQLCDQLGATDPLHQSEHTSQSLSRSSESPQQPDTHHTHRAASGTGTAGPASTAQHCIIHARFQIPYHTCFGNPGQVWGDGCSWGLSFRFFCWGWRGVCLFLMKRKCSEHFSLPVSMYFSALNPWQLRNNYKLPLQDGFIFVTEDKFSPLWGLKRRKTHCSNLPLIPEDLCSECFKFNTTLR